MYLGVMGDKKDKEVVKTIKVSDSIWRRLRVLAGVNGEEMIECADKVLDKALPPLPKQSLKNTPK